MQQDVKADARFVDIGNLPSYFVPYTSKYLPEAPFAELRIRPFTVKELRLLAETIVTGDIKYQIQAVDLVINQPVEDITIGDFFYLLMWLRIHSYPKSPWEVAWTCNNTVAVNPEDATAGIRVCGEHNASLVASSAIEIIDLEKFVVGKQVLDPELDFPRTRLLRDIYTTNTLDNQLDWTYIVPAAQWIRDGTTLADKLQILDESPDLSLYDKAINANNTILFGVRESIRLVCRACNHQHIHELKIEPLTFFRQV